MNHCLLRSQVTMMHHTVWVANTKLKYIPIIEGCVDVLIAYTLCNPATPADMHHFGSRRAEAVSPIFKLGNLHYNWHIIQKYWPREVSSEPRLNTIFFTWTHTTDIISLILNNTFFLFLYLILFYSSCKGLQNSFFFLKLSSFLY